MKLPTKRSSASRSMASAMRTPIIRDDVKPEVAALQRFTPMPTNYDDVGRAQAAAALAEGEAWTAFSNAAISSVDALNQVSYTNQKSDALSKKLELESFIADYYASAAMDQTLTDPVPDGTGWKYQKMSEGFEKAIKRESERLDKKYKLSYQDLRDDYNAYKSGQVGELKIKIDALARGAEIEQKMGAAARQWPQIKTEDKLNSFMETYHNYMTPEERAEKWVEGRQQIANYSLSETISGAVSGAELRGLYASMTDREMAGEITGTQATRRRSQINEQLRMLETNFVSKISSAQTHEEVDEIVARAAANEIMVDADRLEKFRLNAKSRITTGEIEGLIIVDGELTDDTGAILFARDLANQAQVNGEITPQDRVRIAEITSRAARGAASEELLTLWNQDPTGRAGLINDRMLELRDGTANPNDYGFENDDPAWDDFKNWYSSEIVKIQQAYNMTQEAAAKVDKYMATAITVAAGDYSAPNAVGLKGDDREEVMERVWEIKSVGGSDTPVHRRSMSLGEFVSRYRYLPKSARNRIQSGWVSSDQERRVDALEDAMILGKLSAWSITGEPFESARSLSEKLNGINTIGPDGKEDKAATELQNQIIRDHIMSDSRGTLSQDMETQIASNVSDFTDAFPKFWDGDNRPSNFPESGDDSVRGFSVVEGIAKTAYEDALRGGKHPADAMAQAMRVVGEKVGIETGSDGVKIYAAHSIETGHMYGTGVEGESKILEAIKGDLAMGNADEITELLGEGQRIVPTVPREMIGFQWVPSMQQWLVVAKDTREPVQFDIINEDGSPAFMTQPIYVDAGMMTPNAEKLIEESTRKDRMESARNEFEVELNRLKGIRDEASTSGLPPRDRTRAEVKAEAATADTAASSTDIESKQLAEAFEIIDETSTYNAQDKERLKKKLTEIAIRAKFGEGVKRGAGPYSDPTYGMSDDEKAQYAELRKIEEIDGFTEEVKPMGRTARNARKSN